MFAALISRHDHLVWQATDLANLGLKLRQLDIETIMPNIIVPHDDVDADIATAANDVPALSC